MTKKISTIPFGGEIPPELADAFDAVVEHEGWTKKRALAAAVRAFVDANDSVRYAMYKAAYDSTVDDAVALVDKLDARAKAKKSKGKAG